MGQRKGPSGANAPPVHGIKKCLLLVYACRGRWELKYHIADYAEKIILKYFGGFEYVFFENQTSQIFFRTLNSSTLIEGKFV